MTVSIQAIRLKTELKLTKKCKFVVNNRQLKKVKLKILKIIKRDKEMHGRIVQTQKDKVYNHNIP